MTTHVSHADESNAWFQIVAFHTHRNTSLSSEVLGYEHFSFSILAILLLFPMEYNL
jgi:hypothetical protein